MFVFQRSSLLQCLRKGRPALFHDTGAKEWGTAGTDSVPTCSSSSLELAELPGLTPYWKCHLLGWQHMPQRTVGKLWVRDDGSFSGINQTCCVVGMGWVYWDNTLLRSFYWVPCVRGLKCPAACMTAQPHSLQCDLGDITCPGWWQA